jgi:hypothetical protein
LECIYKVRNEEKYKSTKRNKFGRIRDCKSLLAANKSNIHFVIFQYNDISTEDYEQYSVIKYTKPEDEKKVGSLLLFYGKSKEGAKIQHVMHTKDIETLYVLEFI